ncbi:MAG: hypothetical protein VB118_00645 [Oscillospiraceae bacterium]|nr:hypothetical protein [Oscillospiraceae bacterium]
MLSVKDDQYDFDSLRASLESRLNRLYIDDSQIDISEASGSAVEISIKGRTLTQDEINILVYSDTLCIKNSDGDIVMTSEDFKDCSIDFDTENSGGKSENGCYVKLVFTENGSEKFKDLTREISSEKDEEKKILSVWCGKDLVLNPMVTSTIITSEIMVTGDFSITECRLKAAEIFSAINPLPFLVEVKNE